MSKESPKGYKKIEFDEIELAGKKYTEIELKAPTYDQMERAQAHLPPEATVKDMNTYRRKLVAECSGEAEAVIKQIPAQKVIDAFAWLDVFTLPSPAST